MERSSPKSELTSEARRARGGDFNNQLEAIKILTQVLLRALESLADPDADRSRRQISLQDEIERFCLRATQLAQPVLTSLSSACPKPSTWPSPSRRANSFIP